MFIVRILAAALLFFNASFLMAQADSKHVTMGAQFIEIENSPYLAISLTNKEGWHTYWKNPGDAGIPIKFEFLSDSTPYALTPLEWPAPKRFIEPGDILAYGYSGKNVFFYKLTQNNISELDGKKLTIKGDWLVCENICIPGKDELSIDFKKASLLNIEKGVISKSEDVVESFENLPIVKEIPELEIYLSKGLEENTLVLNYTLTGIDSQSLNFHTNLLTPFLVEPLDYKHEKLFYDSNSKTLYGKMEIDWDGIYSDPVYELPSDGNLKSPIEAKFLFQFQEEKKPAVVSKTFNSFSLTGTEQLESYLKTLTPITADKEVRLSNTQTSETSILTFLLFAFLGGLILNLMPCVLPVISLKLFGLMIHVDEEPKKILKHNLFYSFGVISTFIILGVFVLALKASGEKIGWGFQLQSPIFVFAMMAVILIMAMNMLGLFEFVTPGGRKLGNAQLKSGMGGDFFNGVLATILSTPCSAPFLGTALTFAFTTSTFNIFLTFFFVGLGLSFPFLLTGFFPRLISFLPKPGMWMEKLKYILGFTLLLTFVWLYDVLTHLIDFDYAGIYINTIFIGLFFAFFFRKKITKRFGWDLLFFSLPIVLTTMLYAQKGFDVYQGQKSEITRGKVDWKPWSPEKLDALKTSKKLVFMDFTAKWCLTCKVNKKLVLDTDAFSELVKKHDMETLLGDWTQRDDAITTFLNRYNIVGVPAYFVQMPNGEIKFLGETITIAKIEEALKD